MAHVAAVDLELKEQSGGYFKKLMVAYDFSALAGAGLHCALRIASFFHSEVVLVYVWRVASPDDSDLHSMKAAHAEALEQVEDVAKGVRARGIKCSVFCRTGNPADVLVQAATEISPDLLVLGAYEGRSGGHRQSGSTVEFLMRSMPCPTLTVGPQALTPAGQTWRIRNIVYASTYPARPSRAMKLAQAMALMLDAGIDVVHVVHESHTRLISELPEGEMEANPIVSYFRGLGIQTISHVLEEPAARAILSRARATGAGLILFGIEHRPLDERTVGLISSVLQAATCPVMTVPGPA